MIAESMHGAIVADSFGVPFGPVTISSRFNDFNWRDWAESPGMDLTFRSLLMLRRLFAAKLARLLSKLSHA